MFMGLQLRVIVPINDTNDRFKDLVLTLTKTKLTYEGGLIIIISLLYLCTSSMLNNSVTYNITKAHYNFFASGGVPR